MFTVRQAVRARLESQLFGQGITFHWSIPEFPTPPIMMVSPDFPSMNPEIGFSSVTAQWNLIVTMIMDWVDEDAAQEQLSTWLDPTGPVISALRSDDIDDVLSQMATDIRVTAAGDFDKTAMGGATVAFAQVRVQIKA